MLNDNTINNTIINHEISHGDIGWVLVSLNLEI
jgi:hypothetical protein